MSGKFGNIGIYMRLSRDDEKAGESTSIEHQRIILKKYVEEQGGEIVDEYVDDGYSGTNFERPAIKRLLEDAQSGKIDTIVVKDLSRFGRNYIQVGQYIDYIFPANGIRFIALSDNVDTLDRCSTAMDMMPIMNVFNEWHAANTSKKIRAVLEASQRAGKYTSWSYPYGYRAGGDDKRTAIVDEEAASVVRRIFDLRLQGNSYRAIAKILTDEKIDSPAAHFTKADGTKSARAASKLWCPKTVRSILSDRTYLGSIIQHKTTRISYKNHKMITVPHGERIVRENAHEAIIDGDVFLKVQAINGGNCRGRSDKKNSVHPLSGLLVCADCGKKLKFKATKTGGYFVCRTYADLGKKYCPSHIIAEKTLEKIILADLRSVSGEVKIDEKKLRERFVRLRESRGEKGRFSDEKILKAKKSRLSELDKLIRSAFEEKVLGNLPEGVCKDLCAAYQAEKEAVKNNIAELEARLAEADDIADADGYIEKIRGFLSLESLTREMCLQLVERVIIGEKSADGGRELQIYYKF